ncbi:MAG: DUF393 domain-containing protein [Hyphomicrobiales bacterium]|nr:DUF393 domain-containing protein [Hyphomicrobiales bacterium]
MPGDDPLWPVVRNEYVANDLTGVDAISDDQNVQRIAVFYDGSCPLCRREVAFYRRRVGARAIEWLDVSETAPDEVAPGLTRAAALARFHVRRRDGTLVSGGDAFRALWRALPLFRPAALLLSLPGLRGLLNRAYNIFLRYRPALQRAACEPAAHSDRM